MITHIYFLKPKSLHLLSKQLKFIFLIILVLFFNINGIKGQSLFQKYFDECKVKGSTTIYDYQHKKWLYTDSLDAYTETLPASTFKIPNSLIALETKAVLDENEVLKWDGTEKKFFGGRMDAWNKNTDMKNAYKNSTIWFYVKMAERIGKEKYKKFLKEIHYGNQNITSTGTDFWNYGEFGITPVNQITFLVDLYENRLPFSEKNMDTVKEMMISKKENGMVFHDKTGWTRKNGKDIGWWVGYTETAGNVYFFATRLTESVYPENSQFAKCRKSITESVLSDFINE
ncbi:penicillin-binding transpeptidase domain-containing protein [Chryseobacterium sp. MIQD13]|uniref:penicillin-binding transpeptidase domain-containing protein n=1 Tax=Chryseobacterium sp. MIQD13 TaxID=3422310 RepID=UPI003D2DA56B